MYLRKNKTALLIILLIILLSTINKSFGKYKKHIDVSKINLTINPSLTTYNITGTEKVLLKKTLTSGSLEETGAATIYGTKGDGFKIDGGNGLYINDQSNAKNYWLIFDFAAEDGYSSSFNPNHVYYLRCEIKMVYREGTASFALSMANFKHKDLSNYGANTAGVYFAQVSEEYQVASVWGLPRKGADRVVDGKMYPGDYPDSIQIGSSNADISETYAKNLMLLDLTEIFGEGNEPSKKWCDANIGADTTSIKWFSEEEQARTNQTPETYVPTTTEEINSSYLETEELLDGQVITETNKQENQILGEETEKNIPENSSITENQVNNLNTESIENVNEIEENYNIEDLNTNTQNKIEIIETQVE